MPTASLDRFFAWLYRRTRRRYFDVLLALNTAMLAVFVVPVNVLDGILFFELDRADSLVLLIVSELTILAASPGAAWIIHHRHEPAVRWLRDEPDADPEAAWESTVIGLPGGVVRAAIWYYISFLPSLAFMADHFDYSLGAAIGWAGGLGMWVASAGLVDYLLFERAFRPAVRDLWSELPEDFVPPPGGATLRTKLLTVLILLSVFSSIFVAMATMNSTNGMTLGDQLAVAIGTSVVFTATLALGVSLLVRESVLTRIETLRRAMGGIHRGDLGEHVMPMGGDELDELGHSFNQMVDRLRRHDEELRESRARIVSASDNARRQVERDLHDGAQQQLVTLRLRLAMARKAVEPGSEAAALLDEARRDLTQALDDLRDLAHGIYPAVLSSDGLPAALEVAAERSPLPVAVQYDDEVRLEPEVEAAVYFCCVEALQNAAKHAGPRARVEVVLDHDDDILRFEIHDDGHGFETTGVEATSGLQNMADRIGALGGTLLVESRPGAGTSVIGTLDSGRTLTMDTGEHR